MYIMEKLELLQILDAVPHCLFLTVSANSQAKKWLNGNEVNFKMAPAGIRNAKEIVKKYAIGAYTETNGHAVIHVDWERLDAALVGKEE